MAKEQEPLATRRPKVRLWMVAGLVALPPVLFVLYLFIGLDWLAYLFQPPLFFPFLLLGGVALAWATASLVTRGVEAPPVPPQKPAVVRVREVDYRSVEVERIVPPPPRRSRGPRMTAWLGILLTPIIALGMVGLAAARGHFAVGFRAWILAVPVVVAVPRAARRLLAGRLRATSVPSATIVLIGWALSYACFIVPRGDDRYVPDGVFGWTSALTIPAAFAVAMLFAMQWYEGKASS
jgi:hypothetical protein